MLTKDDIRKNLKLNPLWEPDDDASYKEWEMFDEVFEEAESEDDDVEVDGGKESSSDTDADFEVDDDSDWSDDEVE